MKKTAKHLFQNLGLSFAGVLIVFLAFEIYLRLEPYYPSVFAPPGLHINHTRSWWTLNPNFSVTVDGPEGEIAYTINSQGIRSPYDFARNPEKSLGKRIFIIGDSFTFGTGVDEEQTYPRLLHQNLNAHGLQIEVVNLGVSGYGTIQSYERLVEYADDLGVPDIVIYMFSTNDPVDNISGKKEIVNGIRIDSSRNHKFLLSLIGHAYFKSRALAMPLDYINKVYFNQRIQKAKALAAPTDNTSNGGTRQTNQLSDSHIKNREDFQSTTVALSQMITWTQQHNIPLVITTISNSQYSSPLQEYLDHYEITLFEISDVFYRFYPDKTALVLEDGHWNQEGHMLAAQGIEEWLVQNEWLR